MVIVGHVLGDNPEVRIVGVLQYLVDDARALGGMGFHLFKFLRCEAARLAQYGVIDGDLAEVVHRRGLDQVLTERIRHRKGAVSLDFGGPLQVTVHGPEDERDAFRLAIEPYIIHPERAQKG